MKEIDKNILKKAARNLLFEMTEAQYDLLEIEFSTLLSQMDLIGQIANIDLAEPMTFPFDITRTSLREDEPRQPLEPSDILKNAGNVLDNQIKVPKVVG